MAPKLRPKILWDAKDDPRLNSGYGIIGRHLLPYLADRYGKKNVLIYAPVFVHERADTWQGMTILGGTTHDFGENLIYEHYARNGCNLLLMVGDWFMLREVPKLASQDKVNWLQWGPWDWLNAPPYLLEIIRYASKIVPFCVDAEQRFRAQKLPNVAPAIPLGLDMKLWQPMDRKALPKVMSKLGFREDSYNVVMVAANQHRKYLREQLEALALFAKSRPEVDVRLYLHSWVQGGERDLAYDLQETGLIDHTTTPEPYQMSQGGLAEEQMVKIFNCADLVLNVTMEGFGFSHIQAQACGVPVIGMSEGAGHARILFGVEIPASRGD